MQPRDSAKNETKSSITLARKRARSRLLRIFVSLGFVACAGATKPAGHTADPPSSAVKTTRGEHQEDSTRKPPSAPASHSTSNDTEKDVQFAAKNDGPILDEELKAIRFAAQRSVLGGGSPEGPQALPYEVPVKAEHGEDGDEVDPIGSWVPLEGEESLSSFYSSLDALLKGERHRVRILAYGASHTQADLYTDYLRRYLQARFGDGGQGFVHIGAVTRGYKTARTEVRMRNLSARHAQSIRKMKDGSLGLLGAEVHGRKVGAFGEVELSEYSKDTEFELAYLKKPGGGRFAVSVNETKLGEVKTAAAEADPGYYSFHAEAGSRTIRVEIKGGGSVHFFGLTAEREQAGVVIDTLGINGSRMSNQLKWHEGHWAEAIGKRNPSLVIYAFGTNETMDLHQKIHLYEGEVREVIARLKRAAPGASCVLFSPFDFPQEDGQTWRTQSRLLQILEIQERVSKEEGCAYWDAFRFMGGEGSMDRWAHEHPPLASADHIHLTPLGYTDALMRSFDAQRTLFD
jgi:lysophospholipase L1-like esterase